MGIYMDRSDFDRAGCDESCRQRAVDRARPLRFLDHPQLERIVREAADAYQTFGSAITIIDWRQQVFIARTGVNAPATARQDAICDVAIQCPGETLVVPDARLDPRLCHKRTVTAAPHIRFYAGHPIVDAAGYPLGALCVFDVAPRRGTIDNSRLILLSRAAERIVTH